MEIKKTLLLETTKNKWESKSVCNPTAIKYKNEIHLLYRGVDENSISSIGHAIIKNGKVKRFSQPVLFPEEDYEIKGVEDPRVTKIGNTFYLLYTAFDGENARIAYAVSNNLTKWEKKGVISPNIKVNEAIKMVRERRYRKAWKRQKKSYPDSFLWDKDGVLFPEKINGRFTMLHRFKPEIQIVTFKDFSELKKRRFWVDYIKNIHKHTIMKRKFKWESGFIGPGAVPIKIKNEWLLIYHATKRLYYLLSRKDRADYIYTAGAVLLNSKRELKRLSYPLFKPELDWEKEGSVNDVVFPEGAILDGKNLKIFYGCSDRRIGMAELNIDELLKEIGQ